MVLLRSVARLALRALGADERREGAGCLLACHEIRFPAALVAEAAVRVLHGAQAHERAVDCGPDAALLPILRQRL